MNSQIKLYAQFVRMSDLKNYDFEWFHKPYIPVYHLSKITDGICYLASNCWDDDFTCTIESMEEKLLMQELVSTKDLEIVIKVKSNICLLDTLKSTTVGDKEKLIAKSNFITTFDANLSLNDRYDVDVSEYQ